MTQHPTHSVEELNANGQPHLVQGLVDDEISLLDVLIFLKNSYKLIVLFGFVGLALSGIFIVFIPNVYEASAQIQMAQISLNNNNNNNNMNPLGINIEEPALLISRLGSPTSFSASVIEACGKQNDANSSAALTKSIKLSTVKGLNNIVEVRTYGPTSEKAYACANAIFELIKFSQAQILAPYLEEAQKHLAADQLRLAKAQNLVTGADKSGAAMSAAYLSNRDEIKYLLDEITALQNMVSSSQSRATRLVSPIYASDNPVAPKKRIALLVGLLGGLFLGLLIALGRQMWAKLKSQNNEAGGVL